MKQEDSYTSTLLGSYDTPGNSLGVVIAGNTAYVADEKSGLEIIDVSDPTVPTRLGSYNTPSSAKGVAIAGNTAYVADYKSGLQIIDVSAPTAPTLLGSYNTPNDARGIAIAGNTAYVADGYSGLQIIDVRDPTAPSLLGSYKTDYAYGVAIAGNTIYVADQTGLQIIDVSDPKIPSLLGSYKTPGYSWEVAIVGNTAYVADGESGLQIIDVSDPKVPTLLGSFDTLDYAYGVAIAGNTAYVTDRQSGLQIIDVSDPRAPNLLGNFDTSGTAYGVAIAGNIVYVADGTSGLQIIKVGEVSEEKTVNYGESYYLENQSLSRKSYLYECGSLYCSPTTKSSVVTDVEPDIPGEGSGRWIFKSATSVNEGDSVAIGDLVYLQNQQSSYYLDVCGSADPGDTSFALIDVVTDEGLDRDGVRTGTWKIESATGAPDGTPVSVGDLIYLQNQWSDQLYEFKGYLDVYGLDSCRSTSLFGVATDITKQNEPNWAGSGAGIWKIKTVSSE